MDVARPPKKKTGRNIAIAGGVVAVVIVFVLLSRLKPAAPTLDMALAIVDSVRQGDMVREVRGSGTLVPVHIQQVTAPATARVDKMDVQAGQSVKAGDPLVEMSSPDVMIATLNADQQLNQARSNLITLRTTLKSGELAQQGVVASTHTQFIAAKQDAEAADTLVQQHLISQFDVNNKRALADQVTKQYQYEQQRLAIMRQSADSEVAAAQANIAQLRRIADFYHDKQASLTVRAPAPGVVQDMSLQQGQYVNEGMLLLKVVQPGELKAVLQIPEQQAKDVTIGQSASIDTRSNGLIPGHVSRKDPAANAGSVTVDVALEGPLPPGAVPDLGVDGTIQIEKLKNVLYTGRPGTGPSTGQVSLFKLVDDGDAAVRVPVTLGSSSVSSVVILKGLTKGDKVILSDMSQFDNVDRVRLKR